MKQKYTVCVIGAGQLGSRHLQALKGVSLPLNIIVVDPFPQSYSMAKERYDSIEKGKYDHEISFYSSVVELPKYIDLAIVATNSDVRAHVINQTLKISKVENLILEKLLFQKKRDYDTVGELLQKNKTNTWVNMSMRTMPFYQGLQKDFINSSITYLVTGSQYGLITNAIHYADHIAFLTGSHDFTVNTDYLDPKPIPSKRKGFLELNGTFVVRFKNGSHGNFVCYPAGDSPVVVEVYDDKNRYISKESERKAWHASARKKWQWQEIDTEIPFQSQMTIKLVESILKKGTCLLATYEQSAKTHLALLEPLRKFLNTHSHKKYSYYPFT